MDNILLYAFRYALAKESYVAADVVRALLGYWSEMGELHRSIIIGEIREGVEEGRWDNDPCLGIWVRFLDQVNS